MTSSFQNIAEVKLTIETTEAVVSEENIKEYWPFVVEVCHISSPMVANTLQEQYPLFKEGQVIFYVENEILEEQTRKKFFPELVACFMQMGFPDFTIHPVIDEEKKARNISQLEQEKQENDEKEAEIATKVIEERQTNNGRDSSKPVIIGRKIANDAEVTRMSEIVEEERSKVIEGYIFDKDVRDLRSGRQLLQIKITDYSSSFVVKKFSNNEEDEALFEQLEEGSWVRARGNVQEDTYMRDLVVMAQDINEWAHQERMDTAPEEERRVELHAHSTMSHLDATASPADYINQAAKWGHQAIALTDHANVQGFPDFHFTALEHDIKPIYGMEAYIVDDGLPIAYNLQDVNLAEAEFVAFDVETTGLSAVYDNIIELAGVRMAKGNVESTFEELIDPSRKLSETIINLTGITDDMLKGSKEEKQVLKEFLEFIDGAILVAHNASFDIGFVNKALVRHGLKELTNPVIDTLELARFLHPEFKSHRLNTLAKKYDVHLEQHHRAVYDSESTGYLAWIFLQEAEEEYGIVNHKELNDYIGQGDSFKRVRPFHATLLVKNDTGLKNLFKLVSMSNIDYFYRTPRIPRSKLQKHREGLIIGSACSDGEVFDTLLLTGFDEALDKADFYDYIEVQPKDSYKDLIADEKIKDNRTLEELLTKMIKIGDNLGKPVVATGNVHYINPEDHVYREVLIGTQRGYKEDRVYPDNHFRTTNEMLREFAFLGEEKAREIVVANTQKIANSIEEIAPIKEDLYTPKIEGSEEEVKNTSYQVAHELYGEELPELVEKRLEKELDSIIGNGFSVIYLISQKLVDKSKGDGYLVGSRGSVGSSFVASLLGITEVNPLAPHYRCEGCQHSEFFEEGEVKSGFDLEDKECPECGSAMIKDGHNIPFETFLGFTGEKVPDIDLNFSGEYQAKAHHYTKELFGEDYVYKAGTIGTIQSKTAFGYVKAYEKESGKHFRNAEVDRLTKGLEGVKRSTGQHPGGIIVIPNELDVYDFTPIQYPADDQESEWRTTHFDFHSIEENVLKLDILGHDDPTTIKMLEDLSGIKGTDIPLDDPDVMKIFSGTEVLGVTPQQINSEVGTFGVPEFGTPFVRQMLEQTQPQTFSDLLQISGLSHGTDVYLGNAEVLIRDKGMDLSEVIGCRDDIMVDLQGYGLDDALAFQIMEYVRKGRGISDEWQAEMRAHGVPEWYIESCLKIKYMFPKAHAAAYIIMALRIAYFKVHMPLYFYTAYFSVRAKDFDLQAMVGGKDAIKARLEEIESKGMDATPKEKTLYTELQVMNEMHERGFTFQNIDLERSDANNFIIDGDSLLPPFRTVPALGRKAAEQIVEEREKQPFLSKEDLMKRGGASKTVVEYLTQTGVLEGMSDENQISLFDGL